MPLFQDVAPIEELRAALTQVMEQLATQGMTGRHQPLAAAPRTGRRADEDCVDPRYAPAQDALAAGDIDAAVAEYQKLVDANPADAEAAGGLAMAKVLQRTQGVDLAAARAAAAERRDDVEAQTLVADLDMLGGHVDDAFARLVDLVRRTAGRGARPGPHPPARPLRRRRQRRPARAQGPPATSPPRCSEPPRAVGRRSPGCSAQLRHRTGSACAKVHGRATGRRGPGDRNICLPSVLSSARDTPASGGPS